MSFTENENKLAALRRKIRSLESAAVAFSGGVDSAVLAKIAREELGDKMFAVTGISPSVPTRDLESAKKFCAEHDILQILVDTDEFKDEIYAKNPDDRCFYCKSALFESCGRVAEKKGIKYIIEGTNSSEILGHRPGIKAAQNNPNVVTPYVELGITKDDIREMARSLKLSIAEKPSTACLSSRVPTGVPLEPELLKRIDSAEDFLIGLGLKQVRVRHNNDTARIETDVPGMKICIDKHNDIVAKMACLGWKNVVLDLMGYRTGGGRESGEQLAGSREYE